MKRKLVLGLSITLILGCFQGCGTKEATSVSKDTSTQDISLEQTPQSQTSQVSDKKDTPITLHIMHFMGEETKRNGLQTWCDTYTQSHPEVNFEIEAVSFAQYGQMLKTKIAAGDMPDIITGRPREWREIVEGGHVMDLGNLECLSNISDDFRQEMTLDDKVYGLPVDISIKGVFYNKDLFAENNLEVPTTYTEWINVMDTFDKKGIAPFVRPFKDMNAPFVDFISSFMITLKEKDPDMWVKVQNGEAKVSDFPFFKEEIEKFAKRMSYKSLDDYATDSARATQILASGGAPMEINGVWIVGDLLKNNPNGNFGVFPLPWSEDPAKNQFEVKTDDVFMVSQSTKYPDQATDFLNFIGSDEGATIWVEQAKLMTSNINIELKGVSPLLLDISSQLKAGKGCYVANVLDLTGEPRDIYRRSLHELVGNDELKGNIDKFIQQFDEELSVAIQK